MGGVGYAVAFLFGLTSIALAFTKGFGAMGDDDAKAFADAMGAFPYYATLFGVLLAVFVPSKDTIYLMAASEAGEMVVNTPEAKEIMGDLKEILQIQLQKLKQ